ncbi:MAG TPA: hypothetical protein VLR26_13940 [Frankiaceae bacterium]|nr:hypothetical protein [Frankiaceae bacterium]
MSASIRVAAVGPASRRARSARRGRQVVVEHPVHVGAQLADDRGARAARGPARRR